MQPPITRSCRLSKSSRQALIKSADILVVFCGTAIPRSPAEVYSRVLPSGPSPEKALPPLPQKSLLATHPLPSACGIRSTHNKQPNAANIMQ